MKRAIIATWIILAASMASAQERKSWIEQEYFLNSIRRNRFIIGTTIWTQGLYGQVGVKLEYIKSVKASPRALPGKKARQLKRAIRIKILIDKRIQTLT